MNSIDFQNTAHCFTWTPFLCDHNYDANHKNMISCYFEAMAAAGALLFTKCEIPPVRFVNVIVSIFVNNYLKYFLILKKKEYRSMLHESVYIQSKLLLLVFFAPLLFHDSVVQLELMIFCSE